MARQLAPDIVVRVAVSCQLSMEYYEVHARLCSVICKFNAASLMRKINVNQQLLSTGVEDLDLRAPQCFSVAPLD